MKFINESSDKTYSNINNTFLKEYLKQIKKQKLIVTSGIAQAKEIGGYLESEVFLGEDLHFLNDINNSSLEENNISFIEKLVKGSKLDTLVINLAALFNLLPDLEDYEANKLNLRVNQIIKKNEIINYLVENGYEYSETVDATGEYASRGFVLDIGILENYGVRILFDDDEIEKISLFNFGVQTTYESIDKIKIGSLKLNNRSKNILNILNNPEIIYVDYQQIERKINNLIEENENVSLFKGLNNYSSHYLNYGLGYNSLELYAVDKNVYNPEYFKNNPDKTVVFNVADKQLSVINKLFKDINIIKNLSEIKLNRINIIKSYFYESFKYNDVFFINLVEKEFAIKKCMESNIVYDIDVNDYVVHEKYGIGQFTGLVNMTIKGVAREYLKIKYANTDVLYVPVEKVKYLRKYQSVSDINPKLNRLSGKEWIKNKTYITKYLEVLASEIVNLAAKRKSKPGISFAKIEEEDNFEDLCPFNLTIDQETVLKEVLTDMSNPYPMDRLVCGDVGFGKTEIAFRAAFRAILNGYQVLYLCPTTILAKQQYQKAVERFSVFGANIELFDRTVNKSKSDQIISDVKNGKTDFIIGTHRLLSSKLDFNKLGLIIIDEEQRFGVSLKEKIRKISTLADVITLSATPIPRTLQMSLAGLRDFSVINTPPIERMPVMNYIIPSEDRMLKDIINNELARNGQVFYLQNRIEKFESTYLKINKMLPNLKIAQIHGQMSKDNADKIVNDFLNKQYDLLIATTIIETGIDIPNVNTIIIENADMLGLGQLYQLKGRVGRSNRQAYAYYLLNSNKVINEKAHARLNAIREFTSLGSGLEIAKRDLAIRGAGDILGRQQAGFINTIGIEMYNKLLQDELAKISGNYKREEIYEKPLININTTALDKYIQDTKLRIEIHQLINTIQDKTTYQKVKNNIEDRFGKVDEDLDNYLKSIWFESIARKKRVVGIETEYNKWIFEFDYEFETEYNARVRNNKTYIYITQKEYPSITSLLSFIMKI